MSGRGHERDGAMSRRPGSAQPAADTPPPSGGAVRARMAASPAQWLCVAAVGVLAVLHVASVVSEFQATAGLHRWFMTYAEGYHRRGLIGTIFQFLAGHQPREAQIALASQISAAGTYLWLIGTLAVFALAAARLRDRALGWAAVAFAAFAFVNPMWTTRAYDNGYLDCLPGIAVVAALVACAGKRPVLSGALVAVSIVAYWGTIFVWLPLGFLVACVLWRDAAADGCRELPAVRRMLAAVRRREAFSLLLPVAAAVLSALLNDTDAAIAELERIGGQENIIEQTFRSGWSAVVDQVRWLLVGWRTYLALAAVYVAPPAVCAGLWIGVMRRRGYAMFGRAWLDAGAAVLATIAPVSFLLVAFDLARLMAWSYLSFAVVAVFWLTAARPAGESAARPAGESVARPARPVWPWTLAPLMLAALFWTTPTIYAWVDMSHLVRCERFCFKERTPQGRLLDLYRRRAVASPIWELTARGSVLPAGTGHNERSSAEEPWRRVARAGRDKPGNVMMIPYAIEHLDATVLAPAQTKRAVIGAGPHRITISYRATDTESANAETRFFVAGSTLVDAHQVLRAPLPASQTEYAATITPPPRLAGNLFVWTVAYDGTGVFELHEVSFVKVGRER
ncbi:MAG: hypothetical protein OXP69_20285 [Spirochaetaceae bacterium]|nr:hypothetical protein [Spirochaetaceae bacterium]